MKLDTLVTVACLLLPGVAHPQWLQKTIPLGSHSSPFALCYDFRNDELYCSNIADSWVAVIDCASDSLVARITTSLEPGRMCYNPARGEIYVAHTLRHFFSVIDCARDTVVATPDLGTGHSEDVCYDAQDNRLYVASNGSSSTVMVYDGRADTLVTGVAVALSPKILGHNPKERKIYCYTAFSPRVSIIDCLTNRVRAEVPVGGHCYQILHVPETHKLYFPSTGNPSLTVIDGLGDSLVRYIPVGRYPGFLCYNPEDTLIYCSAYNDSVVSVIHSPTDSIVARIRVGAQPNALCYAPERRRVFVLNVLDGTVSVLDAGTNRIIRTIRVGESPQALLWNPRHNKLYVANRNGSSISVIGDSASTTVEEPGTDSARPSSGATIVRGMLWLEPAQVSCLKIRAACLLDIAGRKVLALHSGMNDVSRVAPGVYFVREVGHMRKLILGR